MAATKRQALLSPAVVLKSNQSLSQSPDSVLNYKVESMTTQTESLSPPLLFLNSLVFLTVLTLNTR